MGFMGSQLSTMISFRRSLQVSLILATFSSPGLDGTVAGIEPTRNYIKQTFVLAVEFSDFPELQRRTPAGRSVSEI